MPLDTTGGTLSLRKIARRGDHRHQDSSLSSSSLSPEGPFSSVAMMTIVSHRSNDKKNDENDKDRVGANSVSNGQPTQIAADGTSLFTLFNDGTNERNLSGLLRLPDIDDTSMAHVFEYIEYYEEDLFWSFLSDSLFIVGGIVYMILSIWDYVGSDDEILSYKALMVMGPLVYLVNSLVDITWANRVSKREKVRERMQALWAESAAMAAATEMVDTSGSPIDDSLATKEELAPQAKSKLRRLVEAGRERLRKIQRHAAHRRTVLAAITFGIAAFTAFVAVIIYYSDYSSDSRVVDILNVVSVNTYLISSVISVTGKRTRPWLAHRSCLGNHETLEDLGDVFFFIGSLVDCISSDFGLDSATSLEPIVAAFLWLLDACFYLLSDFVMAEKLGKHYQPGSLGDEKENGNEFIGNSNVLL